MKFEDLEVGKEYWTYVEYIEGSINNAIQRLRVSAKEDDKVYFAYQGKERWQYWNREEVEDFVFETKEEAEDNF